MVTAGADHTEPLPLCSVHKFTRENWQHRSVRPFVTLQYLAENRFGRARQGRRQGKVNRVCSRLSMRKPLYRVP